VSSDSPAAWLVGNLDLLPRGGRVLDVAAGKGRHALYLVARGWHVHAVDRDAHALAAMRATFARCAEPPPTEPPAATLGVLTTEVMDLERGAPSLGHRCYDGVLVFNYLHRPLMPRIVGAVAPGGVLMYETFTTQQAIRGRPTNPAFLLLAGELDRLVQPLRVLRAREGEYDGRFVASVVARRDP
jgi:SAM-dependent methyltransferase